MLRQEWVWVGVLLKADTEASSPVSKELRARPGSQVFMQQDQQAGRGAEQDISTVLFPSSSLKETATDSAVRSNLARGKQSYWWSLGSELPFFQVYWEAHFLELAYKYACKWKCEDKNHSIRCFLTWKL